MKPILAAGEDFIGVSLMANVPHQLVLRRVEDLEQGHGQLHGAQIGRQVPARAADRLNDQLADFTRQLVQSLQAQGPQIGGAIDFVENAVHGIIKQVTASVKAKRETR